MHILDKIVAHKKKEVEKNKELYPIRLLEQSIYYKSKTVSLSEYILREDKSGIIAEFKRRSPSKPEINLYADVESVTLGYMQAGASALSVLTDNHFFGGSNKDLNTARTYNFCPILRKDFIIDPYQITEARSIGADAILLIAEILTKQEVELLSKYAKDLNLEVLMELHSEEQLDKISDHVDLIGVNNRDLKNFVTDIDFSVRLYDQLPEDMVKISESGIKNIDDIVKLKTVGYNGFLIGEQFMLHADPGKACKSLIDSLKVEA
ncbi:MAG: indole-3-glycerol phosphate synthase TrpC [Saprospiraceae bacterium]|nr:indole-3-glycerol phosphate synthase TrpC [Saprospiraceae bacterium]